MSITGKHVERYSELVEWLNLYILSDYGWSASYELDAEDGEIRVSALIDPSQEKIRMEFCIDCESGDIKLEYGEGLESDLTEASFWRLAYFEKGNDC